MVQGEVTDTQYGSMLEGGVGRREWVDGGWRGRGVGKGGMLVEEAHSAGLQSSCALVDGRPVVVCGPY